MSKMNVKPLLAYMEEKSRQNNLGDNVLKTRKQ